MSLTTHLLNNWNSINNEITATASANMSATIIASNILGAADGFLPRARIELYDIAPITADGPIMVQIINMIMSIVRISQSDC